MYLHYRENKLIMASARDDKDNENILRGDYLDKTPKLNENGEEIPFEMPSREELLKEYIFPDWKEGDILIIAPQPLRYPKWDNKLQTLVEMTREEICQTGDLSVLLDGEKFKDGQIVTVEKPNSKHLNYNWNRATFEWELTTTKEELMLKRKDLILKRKHIRTEIEELQEEEEFETYETVELLQAEVEELKKEIDALTKEIKKLK